MNRESYFEYCRILLYYHNYTYGYTVLSTELDTWSMLTFSWMQPLLTKGNQRAIEQSDLYKLSYNDSAEGIYSPFSSLFCMYVIYCALYIMIGVMRFIYSVLGV